MIKNFLSIFVFLLFYLLFSIRAEAANLILSPSTGAYVVGESFSASVYVSSSDQAMNAASGAVSFPTDKLEVVSVSKSGSIFSLWVQEPSHSNTAGLVNFEGIVLNPGYAGNSGKILNIIFKAKATGAANVSFSSGSVLANDGNGTNILTGFSGASFSLGVAGLGAPEVVTPHEIPGTPSAPKIKSSSHPDPNKWYAEKDAKFAWDLSPDITGVRLLVSKIPQAIPVVDYLVPISRKEINDNADGIWYLSVRLKNEKGWGAISYLRFQIDTKKPEHFYIKEIKREDLTEPKVEFVFDAVDLVSGIDHYEIQIDNSDPIIWKDDGSKRYITPVLEPGKHVLTARAVDKAGNYLGNYAKFSVEALSPPVFTEYSKHMPSEDYFIAKGMTKYPNSQIIVWLQKDKEEAKSSVIKNDNNGEFVFITEGKLKYGSYKLWGEAIDGRGAKSFPSDKLIIAVDRPAFLKTGSLALDFLVIIVPLSALTILLIFILWQGWRRLFRFKNKLRKEVMEAKEALKQAFSVLRESAKEQIDFFEDIGGKRTLTKEEEKIVQKLKQDLSDAEKLVSKEIEDIDKEIENSRQ